MEKITMDFINKIIEEKKGSSKFFCVEIHFEDGKIVTFNHINSRIEIPKRNLGKPDSTEIV